MGYILSKFMQKRIFLMILISLTLESCNLILDNPGALGDKSNIATQILRCLLGENRICQSSSAVSSNPPTDLTYPNSIIFKNDIPNSISPNITGSPVTYTIEPGLPSGIAIDTNTGSIYGNYTSFNGSSSNYTVKATNIHGSTSVSIKIISFGKEPLITGQINCRDNLGNIMACTGTGQDAEYQKGSSTLLTDNADGSVKDNITGLLWKKCELGGTYTVGSNSCTVAGTLGNFTASSTGCSAITGYRLPSLFEIRSISKMDNNTGFFSPFAIENGSYWTSNVSPVGHFILINTTVNIGESLDGNSGITKCVSGSSISSKNMFVDNLDGSILDISTGLLWQKCPIGQTYGGGTCTGTITIPMWDIALTNCTASTFLGKTWRPPNINELASLFDPSFSNYINPTFFPTVGNSAGSYGFWSSTGITTTGKTVFFSSTSPSISSAPKTTVNVYASLCVSGP